MKSHSNYYIILNTKTKINIYSLDSCDSIKANKLHDCETLLLISFKSINETS